METKTGIIPFADLKRQYQAIESEVNLAIRSVLEETAFIGGRGNGWVNRFEAEYSGWMGIDHTIGVANGTDALEIILAAWGIGPGDEVIVPALTWFSTAEAVLTLGATPVFADVIPGVNTLDPEKLPTLITPATRVIIPVHLYGQMARMSDIMRIANQHGIRVLEDCAQAHGALHQGRKAGTWGHAAAFSFYPGKNFGAYGDAGAICTADGELAEICRQIANHGQKKKHEHLRNGRNSRLDGIQAAVLNVKLPYLDRWNETRMQLGNRYLKHLTNPKIQLPVTDTNNQHVYHLFVIHHPERDRLMEYLKANGIETALHYPYPIPALKPLDFTRTPQSQYKHAQQACNTLLSIPMFPELTDAEHQMVCDALNQFPA